MKDYQKFLDKFSFDLPNEQIAKYPLEVRDASKLLVAEGKEKLEVTLFKNLKGSIKKDDLIVLNDTKVEHRRVFFNRKLQGKSYISPRVECLFLEKQEKHIWKVLASKKKRLTIRDELFSEKNPSIVCKVVQFDDPFVILETSEVFDTKLFSEIGNIPIPPYFKREANEKDILFYQSVFAKESGSIAAPTASLHFTDLMLENLVEEKKCCIEYLTLHINYGTFAPVREKNLENKILHVEHYSLSSSLYERLKRKEYSRIIAIGTTVLRTLEHVYIICGNDFTRLEEKHREGTTDDFYFPPYRVQSVDYLVTNFHLPRSSLFLLICCLQSREDILYYYKHAIEKSFQFYSYGDAMFLKNNYKLS